MARYLDAWYAYRSSEVYRRRVVANQQRTTFQRRRGLRQCQHTCERDGAAPEPVNKLRLQRNVIGTAYNHQPHAEALVQHDAELQKSGHRPPPLWMRSTDPKRNNAFLRAQAAAEQTIPRDGTIFTRNR